MKLVIRIQLIATGALAALTLSVTGILMSAPQANAAGRCIDYVYGYGGYSACIRNIQKIANGITSVWGSSSSGCGNLTGERLSTDCSFGPRTKEKMKSVQRWGCKVGDGVVGRNTWNTLCFYGSSKIRAGWNSTYAAGYNAAINSGCKPSDTYNGPWPYSTY